MALIFITGAAGVGKSSVTKLLQEQLPKDTYALHDIDESDKWTNDYEAWRDSKIDYWLQRGRSSDEAGITTSLCGIIYPENVEKAPSFSEDVLIQYILLDASADVITKRLLSKYGTEDERREFDAEKTGRMKRKLKRQLEIADELRSVYTNRQDAYIIDTNRVLSEVVDDILEKVKSV